MMMSMTSMTSMTSCSRRRCLTSVSVVVGVCQRRVGVVVVVVVAFAIVGNSHHKLRVRVREKQHLRITWRRLWNNQHYAMVQWSSGHSLLVEGFVVAVGIVVVVGVLVHGIPVDRVAVHSHFVGNFLGFHLGWRRCYICSPIATALGHHGSHSWTDRCMQVYGFSKLKHGEIRNNQCITSAVYFNVRSRSYTETFQKQPTHSRS